MRRVKLRRPYGSTKNPVLFQITFSLVLISVVLQVCLILLPTGQEYSLALPKSGSLILGAVLISGLTILLVANAVLWVGMLHFLVMYDGRSAFSKMCWLVALLCGVSIGAAVYYWVVFRRRSSPG